jgi:ABC-2 type transport system permease protein
MLPVLGLPFLLALVIPSLANEPLEDSDFAEQVPAVVRAWPALAAVPVRVAVQALVFQQFLVLVVLVPVSGAMSIAAHSVIGEKQGRTLEPLLVTPLTPLELLLAKVLAALAPALVLEVVAVALYLGTIALVADGGVLPLVASFRTAVLAGVVAPLASLVGLQLVVLSSTRAKDPRSAQQVGVLVVLPIVGLVVGQSVGAFWLTAPVLLASALGLALAWVGLVGVSVAAFDPERILTRWR